MEQWYKVLVDGKSCHGGALEWSLPKDGAPGDWHEVGGEISLCTNGLHLTCDPAKWYLPDWYLPDCAVYLAEPGEISEREGDKCVTPRARLLRLATLEELDNLRIWSSGEHSIEKGLAVASGSAVVRASGSATVEAWDSATVEASGLATIICWGRGRAKAELLPGSQAVLVDRRTR